MPQVTTTKNANHNLEYPGASILFVDDEDNARSYFAHFLAEDFQVLTAESAEVALAMLRDPNNSIGVVVSDQRMPSVQGVSLLNQLCTEFPYVIRILTSAHADINEIIKAINGGEIYRYIAKPWDMQKLRFDMFSAMRLFEKRQHERDLICEKRKGMYILTERLNDELRFPMMTIRSMALTIDQYLPKLISAYQQIDSGHRPKGELKSMDLQSLEETIGTINQEVNLMQGYVDILLMNTQGDKKKIKHNRRNSMQSAIRYSLDNYPYKPSEKALVYFEPELQDDFLFHGARQNVITIIANLLSNAFFALAKSRGKQKQIKISLKKGHDSNTIYFEDNGIGIAENIRPYIFDEFFSSRNNRIGAGLSACHRAAKALSGSIECVSEVRKFTRFITILPTCESEP